MLTGSFLASVLFSFLERQGFWSSIYNSIFSLVLLGLILYIATLYLWKIAKNNTDLYDLKDYALQILCVATITMSLKFILLILFQIASS